MPVVSPCRCRHRQPPNLKYCEECGRPIDRSPPAADDDSGFEAVEDEPPRMARPVSRRPADAPAPRSQRAAVVEEDDNPNAYAPRRDEDDEPPPRKKKKKKRPRYDDDYDRDRNRGGGFAINPLIISGGILFLLGLAITVGGLMFGWLIFWGPILCVIGVISVIKGMLGME